MNDHPPKVCPSRNCYPRWLQQQKDEDLRRKRAALIAEAERLHEEATAGRVPLVMLPAIRRPLTELPELRKQAFRAHLLQMIDEATTDPNANPEERTSSEAAPAVAAVLDRACGLCQGACCTTAGTHAYVTAQTIRGYLRLHPGAKPGDVLERYLSSVPERTIEGSCVFHGPMGCVLPREIRGDTCNWFFCLELRKYRQGANETGSASAFLVAATPETIQASELIDRNGSGIAP